VSKKGNLQLLLVAVGVVSESGLLENLRVTNDEKMND